MYMQFLNEAAEVHKLPLSQLLKLVDSCENGLSFQEAGLSAHFLPLFFPEGVKSRLHGR